jgi:hypothetical protein
MRSATFWAFAASAALLSPAAAFYLPGTAPRDYLVGEPIDVFVNTLTPMLNSKLKSLISHDYYDERFHFCHPNPSVPSSLATASCRPRTRSG